MQKQPFRRAGLFAQALMLIASMPVAQQIAARASLGSYKSRGKGEGSTNRSAKGKHMQAVRASRKAKNVKRNRAAHR